MRKAFLIAALLCTLLLFMGQVRVPGKDDDFFLAGIGDGPVTSGGAVVYDTVTLWLSPDTTWVYSTASRPTNAAWADTMFDGDRARADREIELNHGATPGSDPNYSVTCDFRWTYIDSTNPTIAASSYNAMNILTRQKNATMDWNPTEASDRTGLVYVDWLDVIPANATILDARLKLAVRVTPIAADRTDSLYVVQMTRPGDAGWISAPNARPADNINSNYSSANYQKMDGSLGSAWWDPGIATRTSISDWGDFAQATMGATDLVAYNCPVNSVWQADISNLVQHCVDGGQNSGMYLYHRDFQAGANNTFFHTFNHSSSNTGGFLSWLTVTYVTKKHAPLFGTSDFAFVFCTDDGKVTANDAYAALVDSMGGNMTMFLSPNHRGNSTYWTNSDAVGWWSTYGHEIGFHSRTHQPTNGLVSWGATGAIPVGVPSSGNAAWDSLYADLDPSGMLTELRLVDPSFPALTTIAFPLHEYDGPVLLGVEAHGFTAIRTGIASRGLIGNHIVPRKIPSTLNGAAATDTAFTWRMSQRPKQERNPRMLPYSFDVAGASGTQIVGAKTDNPTEAQVYAAAYRRFYRSRAMGEQVVVLFTHDLKSGTGYTTGVDVDELRQIILAAQDCGFDVVSLGTAVGAMSGTAKPKDQPAGWGNAAAYTWAPGSIMWGKFSGENFPTK